MVGRELEARHRRLGVRRLTNSLPLCSGNWIFVTSEFSLPPSGGELLVRCASIARPVQPIVADFVTETQYAIFDDARSLTGKDMAQLIAVGNFYSALLDMFGDVIANCRGSAGIANAVVSTVASAAERIYCPRTGEQEFVHVAERMQDLVGDGLCLAA
jgi:hypothetical protein